MQGYDFHFTFGFACRLRGSAAVHRIGHHRRDSARGSDRHRRLHPKADGRRQTHCDDMCDLDQPVGDRGFDYKTHLTGGPVDRGGSNNRIIEQCDRPGDQGAEGKKSPNKKEYITLYDCDKQTVCVIITADCMEQLSAS